MVSEHMKRLSTTYVIREQQIKTTCYHQKPNDENPKYWQHPMLVRTWSNRNSHSSLLLGIWNNTAIWEDRQFLTKPNNQTYSRIQSSKPTSWYFPKRVENLGPHKNLHMDVYSNFIHHFQNLEAIKMSYSRWIDKLDVWYNQTMEYYSVL